MTNAIRRRRSERLTDSERELFSSWVASFDTKTDAKEALGVSIVTLDNVLLRGSGRPDTIAKIREHINRA